MSPTTPTSRISEALRAAESLALTRPQWPRPWLHADYTQWCRSRSTPAIPTTDEMLALYLYERRTRWRQKTAYWVALDIAHAHRWAGFADPTGHMVKRVLAALGRDPGQRPALPRTQPVRFASWNQVAQHAQRISPDGARAYVALVLGRRQQLTLDDLVGIATPDPAALDAATGCVTLTIRGEHALITRADDPYLFERVLLAASRPGRHLLDNPDDACPLSAAIEATATRASLAVPFEPYVAHGIDDTTFEWLCLCSEPSALIGLRDTALVSTGITLARRADDLANIDIADTLEVDGGYDLLVARSKTDQDGHGMWLHLRHEHPGEDGCAACHLGAWKDILETRFGYRKGPLFPARISWADGPSGMITAAITTRIIRDIVRRAGLDVDPDVVSSRSMRVTGATLAAEDGMAIDEIARTTTLHKHGSTAAIYVRPDPNTHLSQIHLPY